MMFLMYYYARRIFKNKKRTDNWRLTVGKYSTARGTVLTTKELEYFEKKHKVKRITRE